MSENEAKKQRTDDSACCTTPQVKAPAISGSDAGVSNNRNDGAMAAWMNPPSSSGPMFESVSSSGVKVKNPYRSVEKNSAIMGAAAAATTTASVAAASRAPFTAADLWERTMALKREATTGNAWSDSMAKKEVLYDTRMFADVEKQKILSEDRKKKIPDVLVRKLAVLMKESLTLKDKETQGGVEKKVGPPINKPMHGDITQLALQKFYIQGVCIGTEILTQAS